MEWINLKDRKPDVGQEVLAYGKKFELQHPEWAPEIGVYMCSYDYDENSNTHYFEIKSSGCGCCDDTLKEVNIWMPAPTVQSP